MGRMGFEIVARCIFRKFVATCVFGGEMGGASYILRCKSNSWQSKTNIVIIYYACLLFAHSCIKFLFYKNYNSVFFYCLTDIQIFIDLKSIINYWTNNIDLTFHDLPYTAWDAVPFFSFWPYTCLSYYGIRFSTHVEICFGFKPMKTSSCFRLYLNSCLRTDSSYWW